jgi:phytoene dehydrogenase-like protein
MSDAIVVGAGPNGLAAAVAVARAGFSVTVLEAAGEIGGGTRTRELTLPGVLHDVCSAVHPMAKASPFFRSLPLEDHGLRWRWPELDLAHPLDGGRAGVMQRSLLRTTAELGADGEAWRRLFGPLADGFDDLAEDLLRPLQHVPCHPVALARFGLAAMQPASRVVRHLRTDTARALFGGVAAHAMHPLDRPTTAAVGLTLIAAGHHVGWPVAAGGSRAITDALASLLIRFGGRIETGVRVTSLRQVPAARVTLLDVSPRSLVAIAGERLPGRVRAQLSRWRYGPAAFKLDLAVEGGVPWAAEECRRAGTVHVGGTFEEIADAEKDVHRGRLPERPFVLVGQQYLADSDRSAGNVRPIWAYAHVPHGYTGDATEPILDQLERFAPGLRERIVGQHVCSPHAFEVYNSNSVGGDIATGANDPWQVLVRPRLARDPYWTGIPGVFLCSAATPPGGGVHGMCGANAARSALKVLRRV